MSTLNEQLSELQTARDNMKAALEGKGQIVTKDVRTYAEAITNITTSSGTAEGVKQFSTIEEMNADTTAELGDLAIVYSPGTRGMTVDDQVQKITFPSTVILDTAVTTNGNLVAVDSSNGYFDGTIRLTATSFTLYGYGMSSEVDIRYSSEDGLTYIRTDGGDETVDFGLLVEFDTEGAKYKKLAPFMQIENSQFNGLFEYRNHESDNLIDFITNIRFEETIIYDTTPIDKNQFKPIIRQIESQVTDINDMNMWFAGVSIVRTGVDTYTAYGRYTTSDNYSTNANGEKVLPIRPCDILLINGIPYICTSIPSAAVEKPDFYKWDIDLANNTVTRTQLTNIGNVSIEKYSATYYYLNDALPSDYAIAELDIYEDEITFVYLTAADATNATKTAIYNKPSLVPDYLLAPTQLDADASDVYLEKEFYGLNGVEQGTLGIADNTFADTSAAVYTKVINQYDNMESVIINDNLTLNSSMYLTPIRTDGTRVVDTSSMTHMVFLFHDFKNITYIDIDSANSTNMYSTFGGCENLRKVVLTDTSKANSYVATFSNCYNITDIRGINTSNSTNCYQMFYHCHNLISAPNIEFKSSAVDACRMFSCCYNLSNINISSTSKVSNAYAMFYNCMCLVNAPTFNMASANNAMSMFYNGHNLTNVPQYNTTNITGMQSMFSRCNNLSNSAIQNIINMCLNSAMSNVSQMNLNNSNSYSPLYNTIFDSTYYSNRLDELTAAGWSY